MRLRWDAIYREAELYKAAVRLYTKPLFDWRKALSASTDEKTLYDFARHGLKNLHQLHRALARKEFRFRPALGLKRNFNGKHRTLYVFPWEERLASLLLYRLMNSALDPQFSRSSYAYRWRGFGVDCCQREIAQALKHGGGPLYVMKRDLCDFFDSIDHERLLEKLARFVDPDDHLFQLLEGCVRFGYVAEGETRIAQRGVPFGTAIACLFANVYLHELDRRLAAIAAIRFFRYADDLLVLSTSRSAIRQAADEFRDEVGLLGLQSKRSHEQDLLLSEKTCPGEPLESCRRFRHLGLEFRADGSVGLARDKSRKIRNLFRYAFRRSRRKLARICDPEKRAALAVRIARQTVGAGVRNVAIIDYYLRHVSDESQLRQLDRWLAEEVLALAFGGGHRKGHFRRLPFGRLREMGLPSLVHRRRLMLHGALESPFFVWKTSRRQRVFGGTAARSRPAEASAFSQGPEAAAERAS